MSAMPEHLGHRTCAAFLLAALSVVASGASGSEIPAAEKRSDYEFMSPDTRAIQDDDGTNPGNVFGAGRGRSLEQKRWSLERIM